MKKNLLLLSMLTASAISAQTLDNSFGLQGKTVNLLSLPDIYISSSFLLPDNKLIVSGGQNDDGYNQIGFMASFTPKGKPDIKFGNQGIVNLNGLNSAFSAAQPLNKIVTASWSPGQFGQDQQLAVSRFGALGNPDQSFGTNGRLYYSAGSLNQYPTCIAIDKGSNIYIGGVFNYQTKNILITRLKPNGSIDSSFRVMGKKSQSCRSLILLKNNSLLAGFYNDTTNNSYTASIMKFNLKGKPDMSFGNNGILKLKNVIIGSTEQTVYLQEAENGSFVVLYYNGDDMVFQKFNADGTPDNSFGINSITGTQGATSSTFAIDENGNILQPLAYCTVKRYTSNGMIDPSFGIDGFLKTDFSKFGFDNNAGYYTNIIPQHDGFYVTGSYSDVNLTYAIIAAKYKTGPVNAIAVNDAAAQKITGNNIAKIILAPNPVHDILNINNLPAKSHVIIMNTQGSVVKSVTVTSNSMKLNIENLSSGTYYVMVKETRQKERFIKL